MCAVLRTDFVLFASQHSLGSKKCAYTAILQAARYVLTLFNFLYLLIGYLSRMLFSPPG